MAEMATRRRSTRRRRAAARERVERHGHARPVHADRVRRRRRSRRSSRTSPRWSGSRRNVDIAARRRRGAVRAARRAHVRRRRRPHRACGSRAATSRTTAGRALLRDAGPPRPHARVAARPRTGSPTSSPTRRPTTSSAGPSAPPGTCTRSAGPQRLGLPVRRQAQLYEFRLQHGFTDVADAAFERLWDADAHDVGRRPRDLQGDRRRRPRHVEDPRRPPPPEVAASASSVASATQARSCAEMVS